MGPDTDSQADVVALVGSVVDAAGRHLGSTGDVDSNQLAAYDLGHAAAIVQAATSALDYGTKGRCERRIADAFVAEMVHDVAARVLGREPAWGVEPGAFDDAMPFVRHHRSVAPCRPLSEPKSGAITTTATRDPDSGEFVINGVKTWCTFAGRADVLMLMARTDADRTRAHRGLSMFVVPKPRASGHSFAFHQPAGGRMEGRAIDTLGDRGMHSFEVSLDGWRVPADCLVGGETKLGQGFYMQMVSFDSGRLQTAARAVGVMQAQGHRSPPDRRTSRDPTAARPLLTAAAPSVNR
jgi:hypothetical protein